ncbi:ATP cone domain-containing protein, partial [Dehalococcoides mccartyi]
PAGAVDKIAGDIEAELYNMGKAEIPSTLLGDMVMEKLKALDNIAYVRFASVYREFTDITQLKKVVDNLVSGQDEGIHKGQLSLLPEDRVSPKTRYQRR